jgi:hypothetical protein
MTETMLEAPAAPALDSLRLPQRRSWRLRLARLALLWTALTSAYLAMYLPLPWHATRPGARTAWGMLSLMLLLALVTQWGIGRRRELARSAAIAGGLILGPLAVWGIFSAALTWPTGPNLGPAYVLSFLIAWSAQLGFLVAALCCWTAAGRRYDWH